MDGVEEQSSNGEKWREYSLNPQLVRSCILTAQEDQGQSVPCLSRAKASLVVWDRISSFDAEGRTRTVTRTGGRATKKVDKKSRKVRRRETVDLAHDRIEERWDVGKIHEKKAVQYVRSNKMPES